MTTKLDNGSQLYPDHWPRYSQHTLRYIVKCCFLFVCSFFCFRFHLFSFRGCWHFRLLSSLMFWLSLFEGQAWCKHSCYSSKTWISPFINLKHMMYLIAKRFKFNCTVDLKCRRQYQPVSFLLDDKRCRVPTALVNRSFALHLYLNVTDGCRVLWCQYIAK